MRKYNYKNYKEYVKSQVEANKRKLNKVWVSEDSIKQIYNFIGDGAYKILCHGVRNGTELIYFKKYFGECDILGTEISDTASMFDNVIQWDFHDVKDEWVGSYNLIYSNSLDHSYDPEKAISSWLRCLDVKGYLVIEWSDQNERSKRSDPLGAKLDEIINLINLCNGKVVHVEDIIPMRDDVKYQKLIYSRYISD